MPYQNMLWGFRNNMLGPWFLGYVQLSIIRNWWVRRLTSSGSWFGYGGILVMAGLLIVMAWFSVFRDFVKRVYCIVGFLYLFMLLFY